MTKVYALFYDIDNNDREDWNVFYTPLEIFPTKELRDARIKFLKDDVDDPAFSIEERDLEFSTTADFTIDPKITGEYDNDEDEDFEDDED
jgi:hypothetical protein